MAHPQTAFAPSQGASVFSALNIMWLLHAALEGPISFIALFFTHSLQFKDEITNTMAVVIKVRRSPLHPIHCLLRWLAVQCSDPLLLHF